VSARTRRRESAADWGDCPLAETTRSSPKAVLLITGLVLLGAGCAITPPASPVPTLQPTAEPAETSQPAPGSATVDEIERLEAAIKADPSDAEAQRDLGFALLQRVRETADPALYAPAGAAFERARDVAPDDALVLVGIGSLQLGKHDFAEALETARRAIDLAPRLAVAHAIEVDALVELGKYDEAGDAAAEMLALGSDLTTLSRVSYLAELHGQLDVAVTAMRDATKTQGAAPENLAFTHVQLGNLLVYSGDPSAAATEYERALELVPGHAPALAGQGRLAVAAGRLDEAIDRFEQAANLVPLPEYVIALADAQAAAGRADDAARSIELAHAEIQLFEATGVMVDLDLALFEADHGDANRALTFAEAAYEATPNLRAADARAWALHRLGRDEEARTWSDAALRLGSRDPLLRFHAGAIAAALGDDATARRDLELALTTDAGFSATHAAEARRLLESIGD
jgi:tetratricopeptide (TPR) repeat protein